MIKRLSILFLGMLGLIAGYLWAVGGLQNAPAQVAYAATPPAIPHIVYLGELDSLPVEISTLMRQNNIELGGSWRDFAKEQMTRPLDALILDNSTLQKMNASDHRWLRGQLENGVIVVGIGVDTRRFANSFELDSFYFPEDVMPVLGPQEYVIFWGLLWGTPEDVVIAKANNALERSLKGESTSFPGVMSQLVQSTGMQFGSFSESDGFGRFQHSLSQFIAEMYQDRAHSVKQ